MEQIRPPEPGFRFPNGQTFTYEVEWRLLRAGVATLHMESKAPEEHVSATADSIGVVSLLYRVHDRFDAYFDPRSFCSSLITKHTEEGSRRLDTSVRFDYQRHKSMLQEKNLKGGASKQAETDIPNCVTDVASGIYYLGSLPLTIGMSYMFPLSDGGKTAEVRAHVEVREEVKTPAGVYQALRVQSEATTGTLKDKGKVWVWYSDDASRVPVQMRARLFWGTLTFRLQRMERK